MTALMDILPALTLSSTVHGDLLPLTEWAYGRAQRLCVACLAGLPTGLHLLARPFDEGTLFRVAYAYEQATMHRGGSPIFPELLRGSGNVSAQSSASSVPFSG